MSLHYLHLPLGIFVLIVGSIRTSEACNGYGLKVNFARSCIDNSIIKIQNGDAQLDKDCNLILTGCLEVTKGFKTAKGKYTVKKSPMPPLEGDLDFCQASSQASMPQLDRVAKMYNVPRNCPIPKGKFCGDTSKKIDLSKYKNQLGIALGTVNIKVEAEHDVGKSCVEINATLSRNKAKGK